MLEPVNKLMKCYSLLHLWCLLSIDGSCNLQLVNFIYDFIDSFSIKSVFNEFSRNDWEIYSISAAKSAKHYFPELPNTFLFGLLLVSHIFQYDSEA